MTLTNPTPVISAWAAMLSACASWPGAATQWFPSVDASEAGIVALLSEEPPTRESFSPGVIGLPQGEVRCVLRGDYTLGELEILGAALVAELSAQATGLALRDGNNTLAADPAAKTVAGGDERKALVIIFSYGLRA